jgi:hypothetical protein
MEAFAFPTAAIGIYHLLAGDRVQYIGQSRNCMARVGAWLSAAPGAFDRWHFYPCELGALDRVEREHIEQWQPPMNRAGRVTPYAGVTRPPARAIRCAGSIDEYFDALDPVICGTPIRRAGVMLNNAGLLALSGFPRPMSIERRRGANGRPAVRCWWRRDEVRAWFLAQRTEAAA